MDHKTTKLRVKFEVPESRYLAFTGERLGINPEELVRSWVSSRISELKEVGYVMPPSLPRKLKTLHRCLSHSCVNMASFRGLCRRHYQRANYFVGKALLTEGWLVRHGRMAPTRGRLIEDYAVPSETLETLPGKIPDDADETKWMFGWPDAQNARKILEEGARGSV